MSLEEARQKINALDDEIVRLLDERAEAAREAAAAKRERGLPLRDPVREAEVTRRLAARPGGVLPPGSLERVYRTIMAETLAFEADPPCGGHGAASAAKLDAEAEILENVQAAPGFYRMRLRAPELGCAFRPGQFFQFRVGDPAAGGPFLRRPFAPSETGPGGLTFVYAVVGDGTRRMTALPAGARARILAPLGNAYTLLPAGAGALLLGGGCGAPSLAPLAKTLREGGVAVTALVAARTSAMLLEQETFAKAADRLFLATDDGSAGCRGTAIDALRGEAAKAVEKVDRIYACGPLPMLRAAAALAAERGLACEVSLEERMACGFGACVGCAVPVLDGRGGFAYRRVCHEGPVFEARTLAWEAMGRG